DPNAVTTATMPSAAIARPLATPIPRATEGVIRVLRNAASAASTHHQVTEPRATPATTIPGGANPPRRPAPSAAARAVKETIVAGLVTVRPSVEAYAQARPRPVAGAGVSTSTLLSRSAPATMRRAAAPRARASHFSPPARTEVTAAIPKTARAA